MSSRAGLPNLGQDPQTAAEGRNQSLGRSLLQRRQDGLTLELRRVEQEDATAWTQERLNPAEELLIRSNRPNRHEIGCFMKVGSGKQLFEPPILDLRVR